MTAELIDRFGELPEPARNLLQLARLRLRARELGIRRLDLGPAGGSMQFEENNRVDATRIIGLIQRQAQEYRMEGPLKLRITRALPAAEQRFVRADALLSHLAGASPAGVTAPAGPAGPAA
jgi:transcription-repair coupling factor (superfamily II helicase)